MNLSAELNDRSAGAKASVRVLLEMRPALEGFAGIPQETRLLFRGLSLIDQVQVEGLIQSSSRSLAKGVTKKGAKLLVGPHAEAKKINRYSRVIISLAEQPYRTAAEKAVNWWHKKVESVEMTVSAYHGLGKIPLSTFEPRHFGDFVWRTFFSKTLPAADYALVSTANHKVCSVPWQVMHRAGLNTLNFLRQPRYPRLNTEGADVFIAQTPYPARINANTAFVVRYHDAVPVFMPHTISAKSFHQASHFYALMDNVRSGAYFACVSEATRKDLLKLFPEAESRAVTIHNMVSHDYFLEASSPKRVPQVIRARLSGEFVVNPAGKAPNPKMALDSAERLSLSPEFGAPDDREAFYAKALPEEKPLRYLLIVSTLEPRKNHMRLVAAWETLKTEADPDLKLVVVGSLGWDFLPLMQAFRSWIDRGELFCLSAVPASDLRVLYKHAVATVCPSLAEGFDYSGVEAMASGGVVVSSDIPVHHEIYSDASVYFDPHSTKSLVQALRELLYSDTSASLQSRLRTAGQLVAQRYQPDRIIPQWKQFLERVMSEKKR